MRDRPLKLPRSTPYRTTIIVVAVVLIALVLLAFDRSGQLGFVRNQADVVVIPALSALQQVRTSATTTLGAFGDPDQLRERIRQLEAENSQLKAQLINNHALEQENQQLRQQVRLEQQQPWKLIGTPLLAFVTDGGRQTAQLGVGQLQGITPGMAVIAQDGSSPPALIGVVESVSEQRCSVLLITDFTSAISVQIYHQGSTFGGLLLGQLQPGATLRLEQVDRTASIMAGDPVVTAGLTSQVAPNLPTAAVPPGIPIGVVDTVRVTGNTQAGDVSPYIDPSRVRYAWVVISAAE